MASADHRLLTVLAWVNVVLHLAGLGFAVLTMRPGSPAIDLDVRRAYLAAQPVGWSLGWGTWMLCALAQVGFYAALAPHLPERIHTARLAVALAAAGMGI